MDYAFGREETPARAYAYSCTLEAKNPPAFLAATPKPCVSRMERISAASVKIEEWILPDGRRQLEVSRSAANTEEELSRFRRLVAKLTAVGARPSQRSKTESGSDCPLGAAPRPADGCP